MHDSLLAFSPAEEDIVSEAIRQVTRRYVLKSQAKSESSTGAAETLPTSVAASMRKTARKVLLNFMLIEGVVD